MSTRENANRILAQKIAAALFTDSDGRKATRLEVKDHATHLGGWCESAAVEQILKVLNESQN